MLRVYALNPSHDQRPFTAFPPPECEILSGCPHPFVGGVMTALCLFLEESGAVRTVEPDISFPWPDDWRELPDQGDWVTDLFLPQAQVLEMRAELATYQLDLEAFRACWIQHLYGRSFTGTPTPADTVSADLAPDLLDFLRRALEQGQNAEWLFLGIPA